MRIENLVIAAALLSACTHAAQQAGTTPPNEPPAGAQSAPTAEASPGAVETLDASGVKVEAGLLPPMPVAVTSFGATHDDTYLYVAGGYHGEPHSYSREGQEMAVRRLPLSGDGAWETVGSLPEGAQGLELVYHAGRVCRFGGSVATNRAGEETAMHSSKSAACLDVSDGTWTALPDLPAGRSSHGAALIGENVYVAGGWTLGEEATESTWHDSVQVLNLDHPEAGWRAVPAPLRKRAVGVASAGTSLVMLGGLTPEGEMS
jgi:N-acetylneuraminic acid mutarotase